MRHMNAMRSGRRGFTLVELLVVMAIIAILVSMTAAGVFSLRTSQAKARTETDMKKIASALDQQWTAALVKAANDPLPSTPDIQALADNDPRRARVIYTKLYLMQEFPQSVAEAASNPRYANEFIVPGSSPTAYYTQPPTPAEQAEQAERQSAACIYLALSTSRGGVTFNPEDIGSTALGTIELANPNNPAQVKKFKVFLDAWRKPITFVRWAPTNALQGELDNPQFGYVTPSAFNNTPPRLDRQDIEGTLLNWTTPNATNVANALGYQLTPAHNLIPYLVSAGPDKRYWTEEDIVSFRLRKQGQRGD